MWMPTVQLLTKFDYWLVLTVGVVGIMTILLCVALVRYFPQTIITASHRALYYLSGSDSLDDIWVNGRVEL